MIAHELGFGAEAEAETGLDEAASVPASSVCSSSSAPSSALQLSKPDSAWLSASRKQVAEKMRFLSVLAADNAGTEFGVEKIGIGAVVERIEPDVGYIDAGAGLDAAGIETDGTETARVERMAIDVGTDFAPGFVAVIFATFAAPTAAFVAAPVAAVPTFADSTCAVQYVVALAVLAFPAAVDRLTSAVPRPSVVVAAVPLVASPTAAAPLVAAQCVAAQPAAVRHAVAQGAVALCAAAEFASAAPGSGAVQVVAGTVVVESAVATAAVFAVFAAPAAPVGAIGAATATAADAVDSWRRSTGLPWRDLLKSDALFGAY